jgi:hypothetical protein
MVCTTHKILFGNQINNKMDDNGETKGTGEVQTGLWWEMRGKRPLRRPRRRCRNNNWRDPQEIGTGTRFY